MHNKINLQDDIKNSCAKKKIFKFGNKTTKTLHLLNQFKSANQTFSFFSDDAFFQRHASKIKTCKDNKFKSRRADVSKQFLTPSLHENDTETSENNFKQVSYSEELKRLAHISASNKDKGITQRDTAEINVKRELFQNANNEEDNSISTNNQIPCKVNGDLPDDDYPTSPEELRSNFLEIGETLAPTAKSCASNYFLDSSNGMAATSVKKNSENCLVSIFNTIDAVRIKEEFQEQENAPAISIDDFHQNFENALEESRADYNVSTFKNFGESWTVVADDGSSYNSVDADVILNTLAQQSASYIFPSLDETTTEENVSIGSYGSSTSIQSAYKIEIPNSQGNLNECKNIQETIDKEDTINKKNKNSMCILKRRSKDGANLEDKELAGARLQLNKERNQLSAIQVPFSEGHVVCQTSPHASSRGAGIQIENNNKSIERGDITGDESGVNTPERIDKEINQCDLIDTLKCIVEKESASNLSGIKSSSAAYPLSVTSDNTEFVPCFNNSVRFLTPVKIKINLRATYEKQDMRAFRKDERDHLSQEGVTRPFPESLVCSLCRTNCKSFKAFVRHIDSHKKDKIYLCHYCQKRSNTNIDNKKHMRIHTGEKPYFCKLCNRSFSLSGNLKKHKETHNINKNFVCDVCGNSFRRKEHVEKHMLTHTGEKPFNCTICGKSFTAKYSLSIHMNIHTGTQPYMCAFCQKGFFDNSTYHKHVRCHTGEKPYLCLTCGKRFPNSARLKMHLTTHSDERRYGCDTCLTRFKTIDALRSHVKLHVEPMRFTCGFCPRKFHAKFNMEQHERIHKGELPYVCDICSRKFRTRGSLNSHILKHSGDEGKLHQCPICSSSFFSKIRMTDHFNKHWGYKPFGCDVCEKLFATKISLGRHMKRFHSSFPDMSIVKTE